MSFGKWLYKNRDIVEFIDLLIKCRRATDPRTDPNNVINLEILRGVIFYGRGYVVTAGLSLLFSKRNEFNLSMFSLQFWRTKGLTVSFMFLLKRTNLVTHWTNIFSSLNNHFLLLRRLFFAFILAHTRDLEGDLKSKTSGDFQRLMIALAQGMRSETCDPRVVCKDATDLYKDGEG